MPVLGMEPRSCSQQPTTSQCLILPFTVTAHAKHRVAGIRVFRHMTLCRWVSFPTFKNNVAQCRHCRPSETLSPQQSPCGLVSDTGVTSTRVMVQPVYQSTVFVRLTDLSDAIYTPRPIDATFRPWHQSLPPRGTVKLIIASYQLQ
jgi:hypothetical protein